MQFHPKDLTEFDDLTEEHLGFSALSDGLGFSKQKQATHPVLNQGAGATLAGNPRVNAAAITAKPVLSAKPQVAVNPLTEPAAPRLLRTLAFALDLLIVIGPMAIAWRLSFGDEAIDLLFSSPQSPAALCALVLLVYFLLAESFGGQSLGKMILGLRAVEDDKYQKPIGFSQAALRLFLFICGTLLFGLGLFTSFFEYKRRPWQDRFSGTIVRKK